LLVPNGEGRLVLLVDQRQDSDGLSMADQGNQRYFHTVGEARCPIVDAW